MLFALSMLVCAVTTSGNADAMNTNQFAPLSDVTKSSVPLTKVHYGWGNPAFCWDHPYVCSHNHYRWHCWRDYYGGRHCRWRAWN